MRAASARPPCVLLLRPSNRLHHIFYLRFMDIPPPPPLPPLGEAVKAHSLRAETTVDAYLKRFASMQSIYSSSDKETTTLNSEGGRRRDEEKREEERSPFLLILPLDDIRKHGISHFIVLMSQ